ncbi:MAG: hypothetical protein HQL94_10160 [Magnetococcales bacterium]|nr:hypothetical protein [Magnetococcales bacterium]
MEARQRRMSQVETYWLKHVLACERSGDGVRVYTKTHGLNVKSFYKWRRELSERGKLTEEHTSSMFRRLEMVPTFVPQEKEMVSEPVVQMDDACNTSSEAFSTCNIRLPNGGVLELTGSLSSGLIGHLLQIVGVLPIINARSVQ